MLSRRHVLANAVIAPAYRLLAEAKHFDDLPGKLARVEQANGGRLGVAVLDMATGERAGYRANERFPMCSTFKFLLAAAVLQRVDRQQESPGRMIAVPPKPLVTNSPLTEPHAGASMTVASLCHAALTRSDNTAANLLLDALSGPQGITRFAGSLGDTVTRLDRTETSLNEALPNDPRDTTSPAAMIGDLRSVLLGTALSAASRDQLTRWMEANLTGLDRLRANLPEGWRAADKTGSNGQHTSNDIAVFWPGKKAPLLVAAYITQCFGPESKRGTMLAEVGRLVRECEL